MTGAELQDARVAALTLRVLACNIAEKLPNCFFIANIGNRLTAGGKIKKAQPKQKSAKKGRPD